MILVALVPFLKSGERLIRINFAEKTLLSEQAGYWLVTRLASCSSRRVYLRKIDHFYAPLDCRIRHRYKSMKRRLLGQSAGIGLPIFLPVSGVTKNPAVLSPYSREQVSASRPLTG